MGVELNCVGVVLRHDVFSCAFCFSSFFLFVVSSSSSSSFRVCVVLYCGLCFCFMCSCGLWVGGVVFCYRVVLYVALLRYASFMVCVWLVFVLVLCCIVER